MYISVFLPDFLCRHGHFDERENCAEFCSERNDTYISTGHFFTAVLGVSGIALPIVLYRAALLTTTQAKNRAMPINDRTKVVMLQRSRGYNWRNSP